MAPTKGNIMETEHYDKLTDEEQDCLFYAIHDAREAAPERWLMEFGRPLSEAVERAIAEQYIEQLKDEASARRAA